MGKTGADEGSSAALCFEVTEQFQLVVGLLDGEGSDDELFAEIAVGWQLFAGFETSAGDGIGDLPHDLAVDGKLVRGLDE